MVEDMWVEGRVQMETYQLMRMMGDRTLWSVRTGLAGAVLVFPAGCSVVSAATKTRFPLGYPYQKNKELAVNWLEPVLAPKKSSHKVTPPPPPHSMPFTVIIPPFLVKPRY